MASKNLVYKQFQCKDETRTLQALLSSVLDGDVYSIAEKRTQYTDEDSTQARFINDPNKFSRAICGKFLFYEKDSSQDLAMIDSESKSFPISSIKPEDVKLAPKKKAKKSPKNTKQEFVKSTMYYLIYEDHIILSQSTGNGSREFEPYLSWLLRDQSKTIKDDAALWLSDKMPEKTREAIMSSPVKKVSIGTPIKFESHQETPTSKVTIKPTGNIIEVIKQMLPDTTLFDTQFDDVLDDANLKLKLEITYDRKTTAEGQKVIDTLATTARHLHDDDVNIKLNNGSILRKESDKDALDLRLKKTVSVESINDKLQVNSLYEKMYSWLQELIEKEEISQEIEDS